MFVVSRQGWSHDLFLLMSKLRDSAASACMNEQRVVGQQSVATSWAHQPGVSHHITNTHADGVSSPPAQEVV